MYTLQSVNYQIEINSLIDSSLLSLLTNEFKNSKKIILVDENTKEFCLEYLITSYTELAYAEIIELPVGEENKQLAICMQVWESLTEYNIDKNALLINLGGGVITDIGGFIASLYKRGIHFINIPTTLLAMVDASIGGQTGVDLGNFKNQIGVISFPYRVFVDSCFLTTLDEVQLLNGMAEMIKHGLISNKTHWDSVLNTIKNSELVSTELIFKSLLIKNEIVIQDPYEKGVRKLLNFGHTVGHALESYFLTINQPVPHGFAVIAGIIVESYISVKLNLLSKDIHQEIVTMLACIYPKLEFTTENINDLLSIVKQDKKNSKGLVRMVLLKSIGEAVFDIGVSEEIIEDGLLYYLAN